MRIRFWVVTLGVVACPIVSSAVAQMAVPRETCANPIAGFSIEIPEDWDMATGAGGNIEMAIDAALGAQLIGQPALWFFYVSNPPEEEAKRLARDLGMLGGTAQVRATGRPDEWEVMASSNGLRGPLIERWLCRKERSMNYVIGAMARPDVYPQFQADIDAALASCKLIDGPALRYFREPSENAYRLTLPAGWSWEGMILRTELVPGYFVWKVQSADGLTGAFSAPPATFNLFTPYQPAEAAAQSIIPPYLQQELQGCRVENVKPLQRASAYFTQGLQLLSGGMNPRVDVSYADYVGSRNGQQVRLRLKIATIFWGGLPLLGGAGNWALMASGAWAPTQQFDELYPVGRGVIASLWTNPQWKRGQQAAVGAALAGRRGAMDEAMAGWDAYIRDMERVPDPAGGPPQEVPNRDGGVWKDKDGIMHRVPPGKEDQVRNEGWTQVR